MIVIWVDSPAMLLRETMGEGRGQGQLLEPPLQRNRYYIRPRFRKYSSYRWT